MPMECFIPYHAQLFFSHRMLIVYCQVGGAFCGQVGLIHKAVPRLTHRFRWVFHTRRRDFPQGLWMSDYALHGKAATIAVVGGVAVKRRPPLAREPPRPNPVEKGQS